MKRNLVCISIFSITFSADNSNRPRDRCLMNPFRDRQPEELAEKVLEELTGNTDVLRPFDAQAAKTGKFHDRQNEKKYKIKYWRIGDRNDTKDRTSINYRVARENYIAHADGSDVLEEVTFDFRREANEIKPEKFSALY